MLYVPFIEAMKELLWDPESPTFNVHWATADAVSPRKTWNLLEEFLPDREPAARLRFLRVFAHLSADTETWNAMNLQLLQQLGGPDLPHFRHMAFETWLEVARSAAIDMIPAEPFPLGVLKKNYVGHVFGLGIVGRTFPTAFARNQILGLTPSSDLGGVFHAVLSLDLDWKKAGTSDIFDSALRRGLG